MSLEISRQHCEKGFAIKKKKKQYFTGAIPSKDLDLPSEASPCSKLNIVTFSCLVLHGNKKK